MGKRFFCERLTLIFFCLSCHTHCAEHSPEVEVFEGKWKDVFTAVNRSKNVACFLCQQIGASINCTQENCDRCYHFSCGEDTGWRFDVDGKEYYCDLHRSIDREYSCRVSMQYFRSKEPNPEKLACELCGCFKKEHELGELLAFQSASKTAADQEMRILVHEKCVRYTTIIDIGEDPLSRLDKEFRHVFTAIDRAQNCASCGKKGATIRCSNNSCESCYHFLCAQNLSWNFDKQGATFCCLEHREDLSKSSAATTKQSFSVSAPDKKIDAPRSVGTDASRPLPTADVIVIDSSDDESLGLQNADIKEAAKEASTLPATIPLAHICFNGKLDGNRRGNVRLVRISRKSVHDRWDVDFYATCEADSVTRVLTVASAGPDPFDQLEEGDTVRAINGINVGSPELDSLQKVFAFLSREIEVMMEVRRVPRPGTQWD